MRGLYAQLCPQPFASSISIPIVQMRTPRLLEARGLAWGHSRNMAELASTPGLKAVGIALARVEVRNGGRGARFQEGRVMNRSYISSQ